MKAPVLPLTAALAILAGCSRGLETKEAVRQGVIDHLAAKSGISVGAMQIEVASVSFRGKEEGRKEADATVIFRAKGAQGGPGMTMNYTLEQKGSRWVVKSRADAGGMPHAGAGAPAGQMPPGHPPVGGEKPPGSPK